MKKLRIAHVIVQPVLVWDDGDELTPGPQTEPKAVPLSQLASMAAEITAQLPGIEAELLAQEPTPPNREQRRAAAKVNGNGRAKAGAV